MIPCIISSNNIYVASISHIWKLTPTPLNSQISQLLKLHEYNLALKLSVGFTFIILTRFTAILLLTNYNSPQS